MIIYDCIIVGAGPAGLTFATLLDNQKILIIDKDNSIGGCHKVNRQKFEKEYYFSEHGPRIYSSNYINLKFILNKINTKFSDLFTKYNLSLTEILLKIIVNEGIFTLKELSLLTLDFILLLFNPLHGSTISLKDYLKINNFSVKSTDFIDRYSRIIDGGNLYKTSLNSFLNVTNDFILYNIYQPKLPNDEGLFNIWYNYLKNKRVDFKLETKINSIEEDKSQSLVKLKTDYGYIYGKKIILALPPENLINILDNSPNNIKSSLLNYNSETEYNEYISVSFHWNFDLNIDKNIYGLFSYTDWGIVAIVLTDYMKHKERNSKTVISCAITITDKKSKNINKTANECNDKNELIDEIFKQLNKIYKDLPKPTLTFINNYYKNGKWESTETAYIKTANTKYIPSKLSDNIYTLGTHNGKSKIHFTSMESAISNAISLINEIYKKNYRIKKPYTIRDIIIVIIFIIIIILIINLL